MTLIKHNYYKINSNWLTKFLKGYCLLTLSLFILCSCHRDRNSPGYEYAADMSKSVAYETYSDNNFFNDGKSALQPVEGTIPREMIPYEYENSNEGLKKAGLELKNPLEATEENIERGKKVYEIFCSSCHGEKGDGKGLLFTTKKFPIEPTNLLKDKTLDRPDGEIYHIIMVGGAAMGSHASQIRHDDRWKTILYIRNVLADTN